MGQQRMFIQRVGRLVFGNECVELELRVGLIWGVLLFFVVRFFFKCSCCYQIGCFRVVWRVRVGKWYENNSGFRVLGGGLVFGCVTFLLRFWVVDLIFLRKGVNIYIRFLVQGEDEVIRCSQYRVRYQGVLERGCCGRCYFRRVVIISMIFGLCGCGG